MLMGAATALAIIGAGTGVAIATVDGDDDDKPLTGETYDRAVEAALAHTGGGTVLETEMGDDGAAYGVEIRLDDGSEVEVELDADFNVIGEEADDDEPGEEDD
jgi:uncharacterized membrane protein YkoI